MNAADVILALDLPRAAHVGQRVAKKLLVENGAVTAADKRRVNDGIEDLTWVAALKPHNIGVPAYRDEVREYLEIAVLSLVFRNEAKLDRLVELVHRAIPYPVLLVAVRAQSIALSAAHKRHAQNEAGRVVLDDAVTEAELSLADASPARLPLLGLSAQPRSNLWALYQGWLECLEAMQAAQLTGQCTLATDAATATARRQALAEHARLTREISHLRSQAERESQIPHLVELNLELKRLEATLAEAKKRL